MREAKITEWSKASIDKMPAVSIDSLFRDFYGSKLDTYKFNTGEKLKLIALAVRRLEYDLKCYRAAKIRLSKECEKLRQVPLKLYD